MTSVKSSSRLNHARHPLSFPLPTRTSAASSFIASNCRRAHHLLLVRLVADVLLAVSEPAWFDTAVLLEASSECGASGVATTGAMPRPPFLMNSSRCAASARSTEAFFRAALGVRQAAVRVGVVLGLVVVECQGLARADAQVELAARPIVVRPKIDVRDIRL